MIIGDMSRKLRAVPLGVPLAVLSAGTGLSLLAGSRQLHSLCGIGCLGLSILHTWQHGSKLKKDVQKGMKKVGIMDFVNIPRSKIDMFVRTVEVAAYIPGRVRLYSRSLVGNEDNSQKVLGYLRSYPELSEVEVSSVTGSILIKYTPQLLHTNKELTAVEKYIRTHVRR